MQIKCITIDDEPLSTQKLAIFIARITWLKLDVSFNNAIDALNYLKENTVDLIFLDIQMDEFSGLQFLEALKIRPCIIITSAYPEYAVKSYDFDAVDYLLKPFGFERFVVAVDKVYDRQVNVLACKRSSIFIKTGYSMERIDIDAILYIEGMNEYLQVVTMQGKYLTLQSFFQMETALSSDNFVRVHKSFVVAMNKIERIERNVIVIHGKRIPISKGYKEQFERRLNAF